MILAEVIVGVADSLNEEERTKALEQLLLAIKELNKRPYITARVYPKPIPLNLAGV